VTGKLCPDLAARAARLRGPEARAALRAALRAGVMLGAMSRRLAAY
jgi:hypothetical protein